MSDFQGVDFLRIDELLSQEEQLARQSIREWVSHEFLPRIQEFVRQDGVCPMDLVPAIAELGLFGANLQGYGCAGMNNVAYGLVMQELERQSLGLGHQHPSFLTLSSNPFSVWWVRFHSSILASSSSGWAIAMAGPSATTVRSPSVTMVAISMIVFASGSSPVISRSIQTSRSSTMLLALAGRS